MSKAYTSNGKRRSSMTHAKYGHECQFCGKVSFGNGGKVSHARSHVRRGEAVEVVKNYATYPPLATRLYFAPGDAGIQRALDRGFDIEPPV
jgi:hypothetical protein